jgi:hypothetical protein
MSATSAESINAATSRLKWPAGSKEVGKLDAGVVGIRGPCRWIDDGDPEDGLRAGC